MIEYKKVDVMSDPEGFVWKYVFEYSDAVSEAVLYRYPTFEERTVLCISVQSGCQIGCTFCGTGNNFIRTLTPEEIVGQAEYAFADKGIDVSKVQRLQIMFMSMGEPMLAYKSLSPALYELNKKYPQAALLISTSAPKNPTAYTKLFEDSVAIGSLGLQFSIHQSSPERRDALIPYKNKLSLLEIRNLGISWWSHVGRNPYCNYCVDGTNNTEEDFQRLLHLFPPQVFCFTFSVVCSADETMKEAGFRKLDEIREFEKKFIDAGYNTRVFDPAGQDSIGGGCGQLWYVQKYLEDNKLGSKK